MEELVELALMKRVQRYMVDLVAVVGHMREEAELEATQAVVEVHGPWQEVVAEVVPTITERVKPTQVVFNQVWDLLQSLHSHLPQTLLQVSLPPPDLPRRSSPSLLPSTMAGRQSLATR
jgi:hypothetical protein